MTKNSYRLRGFISTLDAQRAVFEEGQDHVNIDESPVFVLEKVIKKINESYPDILTLDFDKNDYYSHQSGDSGYYKVSGILAWIGSAIGDLKAYLGAHEAETPIQRHREFSFVKDNQLRTIIQRDYLELQKCLATQSWKASIIMAGSIVEALLLELLIGIPKHSQSSKSPKKPINEWDLFNLIQVAEDIGAIKADIGQLANPLRNYRNLIHPGKEQRGSLSFGEDQAEIGFRILEILCAELESRAR